MHRKKSLFLLFPFALIAFLSFLLLWQCSLDEDKRFSAYTSELFRQEVSGNAITLHYTLMSPNDYHIYDTPVSLGQVTTDALSIGSTAENALAKLHTYNRSNLSAENQLLYDLLEDTFSSSASMAPFTLYAEPLSPLTGTQSQLPVLLSEYQFYSIDDVETYLALLAEFPVYFEAIMDFERAKADAGLFMSADRASAVIEECTAFIGMGDDHYLHATFERRLQELTFSGSVPDGDAARTSGLATGGIWPASNILSQEDYELLIAENARRIEEYVYPAYELLMKGLSELLGTCENENGLCHFPQGKEYYELLVADVTGSDRSVIDLKMLTLEQIIVDIEDMQEVLDELSESLASGAEFVAPGEVPDSFLADSNPSSILASLKSSLDGNFPAAPSVDVSVKYVDSSMEDYLSPAFYLIPAIDNSDKNIIYINPQHMTDDLSLFTTLGHEGYPGHLYQTTYFASQNPSPLRSLLGCGGYTEGWATYCEMMSYYFAPLDKFSATLAQKNASVMLGLYALADMGIHYDGWTLMDTVDFFSEYGIADTIAVEEIYNLILGDPANYLKYYIGYLEFLELKKDAIAAWGSEFTQERFHREVLEIGPVPFRMLRERMI